MLKILEELDSWIANQNNGEKNINKNEHTILND